MAARADSLVKLQRLILDHGFTQEVFAVVTAAAISAFAFGATFEIVMSMLVVGLTAAIAGRAPFKQK